MWLYPSIATKNTIQYNNRSCDFGASAKEKEIITFNIATIKKYLISASIQISRLRSAKSGNFMNNTDIIYSNSVTGNTNAVYRIKDLNVSCPTICDPAYGECTVMVFAYSYYCSGALIRRSSIPICVNIPEKRIFCTETPGDPVYFES